MDDSRLVKLREELEKARKKRDDWEAKVKDLERRYNEAEKVTWNAGTTKPRRSMFTAFSRPQI